MAIRAARDAIFHLSRLSNASKTRSVNMATCFRMAAMSTVWSGITGRSWLCMRPTAESEEEQAVSVVDTGPLMPKT